MRIGFRVSPLPQGGFMGPVSALTLFSIFLLSGSLTYPVCAQPHSVFEQLVEVQNPYDTLSLTLLNDPSIYFEKWDTLTQTQFWHKIIQLNPDTALVTRAKTRDILGGIASENYECWQRSERLAFKDSIRRSLKLPDQEVIYVTYGRNHFYRVREVFPTIDKAIPIFLAEETDPWYAQAILLIESPAQLRESPVGAYGAFQLMKSVATSHGLTVNAQVDEREDIKKSAQVAARLIKHTCIPQARSILNQYRISYSEDDLWFRLFVLHIYHAGALNVRKVINKIRPHTGGMALIRKMWRTRYGRFGNASQNYSQVALASLMELERILAEEYRFVCETE